MAFVAILTAVACTLSSRVVGGVHICRVGKKSKTSQPESMNHFTLDELALFAHELRTSLTAIGGFKQLLELEVHGPVSPAQASALERIHVNQQNAVMLITQFMQQAEVRLLEGGDPDEGVAPRNGE